MQEDLVAIPMPGTASGAWPAGAQLSELLITLFWSFHDWIDASHLNLNNSTYLQKQRITVHHLNLNELGKIELKSLFKFD